MAVELEFVSVIIRKAALTEKFPGGIDAFAATELPNYVEDNHLVRVGFMSISEACNLTNSLKEFGIDCNDKMQSEMAVVLYDSYPKWLSVGLIDGSASCWLAGREPGHLVNCTNGFLLGCPRELYGRLETLLKSFKIVVKRSEPPPKDQKEVMEVLHFIRIEAIIEAYVFGDNSEDSPVCIWANRILSRRQFLAEDIQLAKDLEPILLSLCAKDK